MNSFDPIAWLLALVMFCGVKSLTKNKPVGRWPKK
jgi:hypothetical protein